MSYSVKAIKTFEGHDGFGFSCNLYENNKKIATVLDDGRGGQVRFNFIDKFSEKELDDYCSTLPSVLVPSTRTKLTINNDKYIYVDELVNQTLTTKQAKKMLKELTIQDGNRIVSFGYSPSNNDARLAVKKQYPNATILNDIPIRDVVSLVSSF